MAEYIEREAFLAEQRHLYCENCARRKNGKGKFVYDIGDAPCRSCDICDVLDAVEDAPTADVGWIPVTERVPEDLKFVLVVEVGIVFVAHCEHYYGEEETFVEWHDTMYYPVSPTHWMPLPQPPKEGET